MRTTAAVLHERPGTLVVEEIDLDDPREGEVLVEVTAAGLCHSDVHAMNGAMSRPELPAVLGHEVAGRVLEVGPGVSRVQVGDSVVGSFIARCGRCPRCAAGEGWLCRDRNSIERSADLPPRMTQDGKRVNGHGPIAGLARHMLVHHSVLVPVDPTVPPPVAAIMGCAVMTGLGTVWNAAQVAPGASCVVIGCGGIGLNLVQAARIAGAGQVVAVDSNPRKLELAAKLGATHLVDASAGSGVEEVLALVDGGADHVFEAVGTPALASDGLAMTRPGGSVYIVGISPQGARLALPAEDFWSKNKNLRGVSMGANQPERDVARFTMLYQQGALELDALISVRLPLSEVNVGYAAMHDGSVARAVVDMSL
jgi:S-(hydroxymethyl)glutathione dehydrogenase/alcohol dehydrogenase